MAATMRAPNLDVDLVPLPEVSLISSWHVPALKHRNAEDLPALRVALQNRIPLHDLYFLGESDIGWYQKACGMQKTKGTPLQFAASLEKEHLDRIAAALTSFLTKHYRGPLVGLRPRFAALATYWPFISLPEEEDTGETGAPTRLREQSIKAIRNSLYLARALGCRHVEIVGGSAVPEHPDYRKKKTNAEAYRAKRLEVLAAALCEVFKDKFDTMFRNVAPERWPYACMEVEPGRSYLISTLEDFQDFLELLQKTSGESPASKQVLLNADIAHILLSDGEIDKKRKIFESLAEQDLLGHIHLSDHARSHAADLTPGVYHFFQQYKPWLEVAVKQTRKQSKEKSLKASRFSRVISIELEACNDIHEASRAIGKVNRWLEEIRRALVESEQPNNQIDPQVLNGALMVVDIGNSTKAFFSDPLDNVSARGHDLARLVSLVCRSVHNNRGSVLSFTGDGVIAFFDEQHYDSAEETTSKSLEAAGAIRKLVDIETNSMADRIERADQDKRVSRNITLRAAFHYGLVFVPSSGHLRQQAIGRNVVIGARLCDWISKAIETSVPDEDRGIIVAMTEEFQMKLSRPNKKRYAQWGLVDFKGINGKIKVWLEKEYFFKKHKFSRLSR
jgi:class 3 adenylate cyclase/sugar phosphate isomerase/epimerase